jgi:hypothetical protein
MAANLGTGCSDDEAATTQPDGTAVGPGSGGAGGATSTGVGGVPPPPTEEAECQGHVYQCGDLIDNDGDMLMDYQDPDCLGACDNTEDSYYGGIPGQAGPACDVDCYFDPNSGSGNDDCYWNHKCDDHEVDPDYYPEPWNGNACAHDENTNIGGTGLTCADLAAEQSQDCMDYCGPLTPNGCDCFGCCELPAGSGNLVWLGSGEESDQKCDIAHVNDPTVCHPCEQVPACVNGCAVCELCIGKTTLPPECDDPECPEGAQPCGLPGSDPCPSGEYCVTGCCQVLPT